MDREVEMDFTGIWRNQRGSVLEVRVEDTRLSGWFAATAGGEGEPVAVSGLVQDDLITFHASFPKHGTIVSWVGQHTILSGVGVIEMQWLHASNIPDDRENDWMWTASRLGHDVFIRNEDVS